MNEMEVINEEVVLVFFFMCRSIDVEDSLLISFVS